MPGYAVTSYGSQGKTVDYVLFSDSTIKAATNAQQWYVTISRGRRGIRIFTPDKEQLRENVTRSGHRPLAMEFAGQFGPRRSVVLWDRLARLSCFASVVEPPRFSVVSNTSIIIIIKSYKNMSTKTPECWASDPQAHALRVEVSSERSLLLPFDQFSFSELTSEGKEQHLRLVFATHEIVVRGHALRRLETVMQRMELAFIARVVESSRSLAAEGQPVICEIIVTECSPPSRSTHDSQE